MSKYVVTVGDIKGDYNCFACFCTADFKEVIEIFSDITVNDIKDYTLVLGSNIYNDASWNEQGKSYGDIVSAEHILFLVDELLQKQGLSIEVLKCKIEVNELEGL